MKRVQKTGSACSGEAGTARTLKHRKTPLRRQKEINNYGATHVLEDGDNNGNDDDHDVFSNDNATFHRNAAVEDTDVICNHREQQENRLIHART